MKTVKELRDEMCDIFEKLRSGEIETSKAKELSNAAGKIISTTKAQLEYAKLRKEKPTIEFLETKS